MALDRLTKIDGGGISTTSDYRVGVITATKFVGPIEGTITSADANFTGNVTIGGTLTYEDVTNIDSVGLITARDGIDCNGDIDVDGHTNLDNVSIAGVTTFAGTVNTASIVSTGIDLNGDLDVDGHTNLDNVSIAGVTTTNDHIYIKADSKKLFLGGSQELSLWHNGTDSFIKHTPTSGGLYMGGKIVSLNNQAASRYGIAYFENPGDARLYWSGTDNGVRLKTTQAGIEIPLDLDVDGHTNLDNVSVAGVTTFAGNTYVNDSFTINDTGSSTPLSVLGNFGTGDTVYIQNNTSGGHVKFGLRANDSDGNHHRAYITAERGTGATANGKLSIVARRGNGTDFGWIIDAGVGIQANYNVIPETDSTHDLGTSSVRWANVYADTLYGDGSNLTGITQTTINNNTDNYVVTATGTANTLQGEANLIYNGTGLGIGESSPANLLHVKVSDAGVAPHSSAQIVLERNGTNYLQFLTAGANTSGILFGDTADIDVGKLVYDHNLGHMQFQTEATLRMSLTGTGDLKLPDNGAMEFGGSLTSGSGDLRIYHASSDNNSYIVEGGSGSLMIQGDIINIGNVGSSRYYIRAFDNGAVQLRYGNNLTKLATTETGIEVTGEVAATQDYPNFQPTLDFNFAATKKLDPRLVYRRTGPASFTDEFGKLIKVGDNVPRFTHNFGTGESLGLLIEESSTNISRYSEQASGTTNWTQFGTISENVIEAPDGTMTADKLEAPTSGHGLINIALSWTANVPHTFSIFAKSGEFNRIGIRLYDGTSYFMRTTVDLDTGEAVNNEAGTLKVDKFANGWWRISTTGTPVATYTYNSLGSVEPHKNSTVQNADPSSSKEGIYIWGWQMEAQSYPTSYIATNGAAVTRGNEFVRMDGKEFSDLYNEIEGTFVSQHEILKNQSNMGIITFCKDFSSAERVELRATAANSALGRFEVVTGSSSIVSLYSGLSHSGFGEGKNNKYAFAFKKDDYAGTVNGVTPLTDTSGNMPTEINSMMIGDTTFGVKSNVYIKRIMYYPKRLSNSQLVTLTS